MSNLAQVSLNTTAQNLATAPYGDIGELRLVDLDNATATARTVTIRDSFTPTASNQVASPTAQTPTLLSITVAANSRVTLGANQLGDTVPGYDNVRAQPRFLGTLQAIGAAIDAAVLITVLYDLI